MSERFHGGDIASFVAERGREPLDFSVNVTPFGLPAAARAAAIASLDRADRYPDPQCRELTRALARHEGVPERAVVCGNGASDLIWRLAQVLRPRRALVCAPTFSEYAAAAEAAGAEVRSFSLGEGEGFAVTERFAAAVHPGDDLVFLCNPNNPTGRLAAPEAVDALVARCRAVGAVLVVDECFLGFTGAGPGRSIARRAASAPGLVMLSALTKLYGMAGLRLGYAVVGDERLAGLLRAAGSPWAVSSVAQAAGIAALADPDGHVARTRALVAAERSRLAAALADCGMAVVPSDANYLLFRSPCDDLPVRLAARGVLVRSCDSFEGLGPAWVRVAVRTREENDQLIATLRAALGPSGAAHLERRDLWPSRS